jgi:hypothetical protein
MGRVTVPLTLVHGTTDDSDVGLWPGTGLLVFEEGVVRLSFELAVYDDLLPEGATATNGGPQPGKPPAGGGLDGGDPVGAWAAGPCAADASELALRLVTRARQQSLDSARDGPFARAAKDNDICWKHGGRPDDVTVLVAVLDAGSTPAQTAQISQPPRTRRRLIANAAAVATNSVMNPTAADTDSTGTPSERATRSAVRCRVPVSVVGVDGSGMRWTFARAIREASLATMIAPSIFASSESRCGLNSASRRKPPEQIERTSGPSPITTRPPRLALRTRSSPSRSGRPGATMAIASAMAAD